jgi:peptidoglycan/xylan/chitin deacetylase (PgdA/CDA1 family)
MPFVLAYHSHNVGGDFSPTDDHEALRKDLAALTRAGLRIAPLARLVDWLDADAPRFELDDVVCLSFDDGCDLDVRDVDFPGVGQRRSFLGILRDFQDQQGKQAQPALHATSFVIASGEARRSIDQRSLFGRGWMSETWWLAAMQDPLLEIGNHGWDHNHPDVDPQDEQRGGFAVVDNQADCVQQVVAAARVIEHETGAWPDLFAYPFGESSAYIREQFFPENPALHRCRAAFGTDPGAVSAASDRWNLPRLVCGRDWQSSGELLEILGLSNR